MLREVWRQTGNPNCTFSTMTCWFPFGFAFAFPAWKRHVCFARTKSQAANWSVCWRAPCSSWSTCPAWLPLRPDGEFCAESACSTSDVEVGCALVVRCCFSQRALLSSLRFFWYWRDVFLCSHWVSGRSVGWLVGRSVGQSFEHPTF